MPNLYYVYTVLYSETASGDYRLIGFQKKAKGYYFSDGKGSGSIIPNGQRLNGATKFALPGGQFEGDDWDDDDEIYAQCEKEFTEECGREISFPSNDEMDDDGGSDGDVSISLVAHLARWGVNIRASKGTIKGYAAMYLKVPDNKLETIADYLTETLGQGALAEQDVISKKFKEGDYDKIGQTYPLAPLDDEISLTDPPFRVISGKNFDRDPLWEVLSAEGNDWFVNILKNLKNL